MKIAVVGCGHGELETMYETIALIERKHAIRVDVLVICGDFQAVRNERDLQFMACPPKYRDLRTFHRFYSGQSVAPVLTLFIGGNHEAMNHLWELPLGGWVAPNIYYLGFAGVLELGGIRIGGLSGIYKDHDFMKGHFERPLPYADEKMIRSFYHVREMDVFRLMHLGRAEPQRGVDVFLSHDWPRGIAHYGNVQQLIRRKQFLASEIHDGSLGSGPAEVLLHHIQPRFWFSAHLHVKFAAIVSHAPPHAEGAPDEAEAAPAPQQASRHTRFLALDKCLPGRDFLQVLDIAPAAGSDTGSETAGQRPELRYDPEWLAILRATSKHMDYWSRGAIEMPKEPLSAEDVRKELEWVLENIKDFRVPENFVVTTWEKPLAGTTGGGGSGSGGGGSLFETMAGAPINPQTAVLCGKLGIANPCVESIQRSQQHQHQHQHQQYQERSYERGQGGEQGGGLRLSGDDDDEDRDGDRDGGGVGGGVHTENPDRINLDDDDDGDDDDEGEGGGEDVQVV